MSDKKRDFEADRKLCETVPGEVWTFCPVSDDIGVGVLECHARGQYSASFGTLHLPDGPYSSLSGAEVEVAGRFIVEAKQGWPAALDEIEALNKIIHDLQIDSEAYRLGFEAGKAEEAKETAKVRKEFVDLFVRTQARALGTEEKKLLSDYSKIRKDGRRIFNRKNTEQG